MSHRHERSETHSLPAWRTVVNPFKRRRASPPAEVAAQIAESGARRSPAERSVALRERFASARLIRAARSGPRGGTDMSAMAITVIPAQRRGHRTWSPDQDEIQEANVVDEGSAQDAPQQQRQTSDVILAHPRSTCPPSRVPGTYEMPVLVIPAPRRGQRTWSPEDAYTGPVLRSPVSSPILPDPPPDGGSTRSPVYSMRGSLMISEDQGRSHPLRSTYARSSPVFAREHGSASSSKVTPPVVAASPHLDRVTEQHEGPSASSPGDQVLPKVSARHAPANSPDKRPPDDASGHQRQ